MPNNQQGFTLLELLLYVGICGIMLIGIVSFVIELETARVKQITISEVEQQGVQVMEYMTQALRNARVVNTPTPGTSAQSISFEVSDSANTPTVFSLSSGVLQVAEGPTPQVTPLTSAAVIVQNMTVENQAYTGGRDIITIQLTLSHTNPSGTSAYHYEQTFTGTAQLHPNN